MAKVNINFDKFFAESNKEKYLNSKVQQDRIDAKILDFLNGRYSEKVTVLVNDNQKLSLFISSAFNVNVCLLSDVIILILSIVYCKLNVYGSGFYDSIYILKYHIPDIASSILNS